MSRFTTSSIAEENTRMRERFLETPTDLYHYPDQYIMEVFPELSYAAVAAWRRGEPTVFNILTRATQLWEERVKERQMATNNTTEHRNEAIVKLDNRFFGVSYNSKLGLHIEMGSSGNQQDSGHSEQWDIPRPTLEAIRDAITVILDQSKAQ